MIDEDLEPLVPRELRRLETHIPRYLWQEPEHTDWETAKRHIAVYSRSGAGQWSEFQNDGGVNFLTVLADGTTSERKYAVLWIPPDRPASGAQFQFRVHTPDGRDLCSAAFEVGTPKTEGVVSPIPDARCENR
jgi:hypothetical protein